MDCETGYLKVEWASRLIFTHISQHVRLEIPMDLRDPSALSPPRPGTPGRGGRGVRGRALTCKTQVQWFVYASETRMDIEFTINIQIKTQCKPLTPSRSPRVQGEGSKIKRCG